MTDRDFSADSYERHAQVYTNYASVGAKSETAQAWLRPGTINSWRFERMYVCAKPLLEAFSGANWLTVGDGRYGMDAMYLHAHGARALATDISGTLLEEARTKGLIQEYRVENAEALSFHDRSFDFVLCKESYHHFPRPMCALHEMLRVASRAVLLIEANDQACPEKVALGMALRTVAFKESPSGGVKDALRRHGYDVVALPENPFVAVTQSPGT